MDCDTTGIEPDFALVKYKQLAGGGMLKIVNRTVPQALRRIGYSDRQVEAIVAAGEALCANDAVRAVVLAGEVVLSLNRSLAGET